MATTTYNRGITPFDMLMKFLGQLGPPVMNVNLGRNVDMSNQVITIDLYDRKNNLHGKIKSVIDDYKITSMTIDLARLEFEALTRMINEWHTKELEEEGISNLQEKAYRRAYEMAAKRGITNPQDIRKMYIGGA